MATDQSATASSAGAKRRRQSPTPASSCPEAPDVDDGRHFTNHLADFMGDSPCGASPQGQLLVRDAATDAWQLSPGFRQRVEQRLHRMLAGALPQMMALPASDRSVYTGKAGVAYMLWHLVGSGQVLPDSERHLAGARAIVAELERLIDCRRPSFLCGDAGVLALATVLHWPAGGDRDLAVRCLHRLLDMRTAAARPGPRGPPNEMLYGRCGYLYALAFVAWQLGPTQQLPEASRLALADAAREVARQTLADGAALWRERLGEGEGEGEGLLYEWHDSIYFGAAHGLCGIIGLLASLLPSLGLPASEMADFRRRADATVSFLRRRQFRSLNFPSSLGSSERDRLVHWCHGATGFSLMFLALGDLPAALQCGAVVWRRGLLHKGDGLCHGVAGNGYALLRLHRATGDPRHLHRAAAFGQFLLDFSGQHEPPRRVPDRPLSLFEGLAGQLCFLADLAGDSRRQVLFPAAELPPGFAF